jgi:hypothetical protein
VELERERAQRERLGLAVRVKDALQEHLAAAEQVLQAAAAQDPVAARASQVCSRCSLLASHVRCHASSFLAAPLPALPALCWPQEEPGAEESIASLARQLSAMTFQQRVDVCGRLFRATAPALEAVEQLGARDGESVRDVLALDGG